MKVFRGSSSNRFIIRRWFKSRYGFPCLFFASKPEHAALYADFWSKESGKNNHGFIHEAEITGFVHEVDYGGGTSYAPKFRNLIYKLKSQNLDAVRIKNVFDYPSPDLMVHTGSDVIVVFNFKVISSVKLLEANRIG
jgi:hypothetical protein